MRVSGIFLALPVLLFSMKGRADNICEDVLQQSRPAIEEIAVQAGAVAAHIYMDSSDQPYVFTAFPEGNTGLGVWFRSPSKVRLSASRALPIDGPEGLHGVEVQIHAHSRRLQLLDSVLGSMRFVRDRELGQTIPPEVQTTDIQLMNGSLVFHRLSLNGLTDYVLVLVPLGSTKILRNNQGYALESPSDVRFRLISLTSEMPLTPVSPADVFQPDVLALIPSKKLHAFSFLLRKEKLMAGSPRYLSKFGRDSIYTLRVLMSALKPEAVENLLNATISSLHPEKGLVSHEQHEGDFASYVRLKNGQPVKGVTDAIEDYKMLDDDNAFVAVLGEYVKHYPERANTFLNGTDQRGLSRRDLVTKLFGHILQSTAAFTDQPVFENLLHLGEGETTGQWRDSENGLAGGRYPFDVNAAFVPAALHALADIYGNPSLDLYNPSLAAQAQGAFNVWNTKVLPLFQVDVPADKARELGEAYRLSLNIFDDPDVKSPSEDVSFPALSLDQNGKPLPIMHSDDSLMMTFGYPSVSYLREVCQRLTTQFPYGLKTPAGLLVANPVFASTALQSDFDETKYHGRVSWTMQEDLMIFGIGRQLQRKDLPADLRASLQHTRQMVEDIIHSRAGKDGTEVFSIFYRNGQWTAVPFNGDAKSNSNQLWSHLRLLGDPSH